MSISRLYTQPLLPATASIPQDHLHQGLSVVTITSGEFERTLWHNRMGHLNHADLANLSKYVDGIPRIKRGHSVVDQCPTCLESKLRRSAQGSRLTGVTGDTAILIVIDLFSGALKGVTSSSKQPPLNWLNRHLARIKPKGILPIVLFSWTKEVN